ncbi:MAG: ABC transporter substrate-binding protein [Solirubrobacterales bacterium]
MGRVAALLAAVLCGLAVAGCGDGAEPGAPAGATLVLDFQPNAVHTGVYAAKERGLFSDEGLDLEIREPSGSADSARLLEAGRAEFAVMDINDFGIARQRGLGIVAIAALVQRPLAAVIAADGEAIRTPADLAGQTVGVTGVPSDDAVLDTVLASAGLPPEAVERQTVAFQAAPLLASGRLAAATAFWSAEGVDLAQQGVPTREFRVDELGAPRYPELVVAISEETTDEAICAFADGLAGGYEAIADDPGGAVEALTAQVPELDPDRQRAQFAELVGSEAFVPASQDRASPRLGYEAVSKWSVWASRRGVIEQPPPAVDEDGAGPRPAIGDRLVQQGFFPKRTASPRTPAGKCLTDAFYPDPA